MDSPIYYADAGIRDDALKVIVYLQSGGHGMKESKSDLKI